ncbi:MAG: class I SAM-dependent methyltransferase [Alphaproteobacteria bacterium]|nr:class I SAM-dependent methyltransferase [Alphaproteobacteria bacterium]
MAQETTDIQGEDPAREYIENRNALLKDVKPETIRKAWFTLSHLLLEENAKVLDIGCDDGEMTYAMAVLYPWVQFIGIDKNKRQINKANTLYELHNLEFQAGDAAQAVFEPKSFDAIINSFVLHEIYSSSRYNETIVSDVLQTHFDMLKEGGIMFIRDYSRPPPEEFVLIELPDQPSKGSKPSELSVADLLVWYSEHARPRHDAGTGGFFLEELPQRVPNTRLFRLPHKWAYEFIMRKDDRAHWDKDLPIEYTYYTPREFRKELRKLGARVQYSGPHWDEDYIEDHFDGKMRIFDDNYTPMGFPPTSYIAIAYKMAERKSLHIHERRPSQTDKSSLKITAVRDQVTGDIVDIVSRDLSISEVLPYRIDENGRLKIYLHDGVPRNLVNSVPRNGESFDYRRWSGHMVEPIAIENSYISSNEEWDVKKTALFARDHLGLKPHDNSILEIGPDYFPSADYIDDKINTYYLHVSKAKDAVSPKNLSEDRARFHAKGRIREMDAQQVLDAISVGFIPNAHLELQILYLFNHLNMRAENWTTKDVKFKAGKIKQKTNLASIIKNYGLNKDRFKNVKGTAGQLRSVHSIFVEEGLTKGAVAGLSSLDADFVVHNENTVNTAVVLPLSKGEKNDVHAGFIMKQMPIPQRHTGNANIISAPSFNLPRNVTNLKHAKEYIAKEFGVLPDNVIKMGESYFSHIGMTPHRIHPFAVMVPQGKPDDPTTKFLPFYQFMLLRRSVARESHFMIAIARAYKYFHEDIRYDFIKRVKAIVQERFNQSEPDWSLPLTYEPAPLPIKEKTVKEMKVALSAEREKLKQDHEEKPAAAPLAEQKKPAPAPPEPETKKSDPNIDLIGDFGAEVDEFIEAMEQAPKSEPAPEKW